MTGTLEGKVALVTGAGSGIGRASALTFAREGAKVVVADVNAQGGEETVSKIKESGGDSVLVHADVSNAADVEAMVASTVEAFGRLDFAHNNAGISNQGRGGLTHEYPEDTWDRVIDINLKGVWLCMKYEIPQMLEQGGGAIVNTASIAGLIGLRNSGAYVASKHGVVGLTKTAALEYAQHGIRVNCVCPGYIETSMTSEALSDPERRAQIIAAEPIGRVGTPEEVAQTVVWLCSDAASFVTGHAMTVDGGYMAQ